MRSEGQTIQALYAMMRTLAFTVAEQEGHWKILNKGVSFYQLFSEKYPQASGWKIYYKRTKGKQEDQLGGFYNNPDER